MVSLSYFPRNNTIGRGTMGILSTILPAWILFLFGYLVNVIQGALESWVKQLAFISVILLPIVGNPVEHASANPFYVLFYLTFILTACSLFSNTWFEVFGLFARYVAKKLKRNKW